MGASNIGGRWLAREQHEIGAATDEPAEQGTGSLTRNGGGPADAMPPLYPITDCMSERALVEWWMVVREFGCHPQ